MVTLNFTLGRTARVCPRVFALQLLLRALSASAASSCAVLGLLQAAHGEPLALALAPQQGQGSLTAYRG